MPATSATASKAKAKARNFVIGPPQKPSNLPSPFGLPLGTTTLPVPNRHDPFARRQREYSSACNLAQIAALEYKFAQSSRPFAQNGRRLSTCRTRSRRSSQSLLANISRAPYRGEHHQRSSSRIQGKTHETLDSRLSRIFARSRTGKIRELDQRSFLMTVGLNHAGAQVRIADAYPVATSISSYFMAR
jgi:hypothetical protein